MQRTTWNLLFDFTINLIVKFDFNLLQGNWTRSLNRLEFQYFAIQQKSEKINHIKVKSY